MAGVEPRPARRTRHRRRQSRRPARRTRLHLVPLRPAVAPDRDDLRRLRHPGARAVVVRDVRRRPVDPRRHALGRDARPRGRRAPVDHHSVDRPRAAGLRRLGAGLRSGPRMGAAPRPWPPGPAGRHLRLLPPEHPAGRPVAGGDPDLRRRAGAAPPGRAGRRLPAPWGGRAAGAHAGRHGRGAHGGAGRRWGSAATSSA